jgi:hypothetical protein
VIAEHALPILALTTSALAVAVWGVVFVRSVRAYVTHIEHRLVWMTMAIGASLASIGTLSSAIGFSIQRGFLPEFLPMDVWAFIASVGRGALLMAGLIVLTHYRPPKRTP